MLQRVFFLFLFAVAIVIGITTTLNYIDFQSEHFVLLLIFLIIMIAFDYMHSFQVESGSHISIVPNYGFPFILLTNPLMHLILIIIFEIYTTMTDKTIPKKEKFWEFIYNFSSMHILNTGAYYLFYLIFKDKIEFTVFFMVMMASILATNSMLSKLSLLLVLYMQKQISDTFDYTQFFFKQTFHNVLLSSPVFMLLVYSFSTKEYVIFGITLFLQIFIAKTLKQAGESMKQTAELDAYKKIAYKDPMADCYNRRFLKEQLKHIEKERKPVSIVVTDMDNFKVFNDSFNHDVGDQVIEWFVSAIKRFLHPNEYLIRSGGEEFIFILNHCDKQKTLEKVEEIRSFIEKEKIPITFNDEELELSCTASFGISFYEGKRNQTLDSTLIYADNLLYESKHNGKNQITCK